MANEATSSELAAISDIFRFELSGFAEVARIEVQGKKVGESGCSLEHAVEAVAGEVVKESIVEYDKKTCGFVLAHHPAGTSDIPADLRQPIDRPPAASAAGSYVFSTTETK